MSDTIPEAPEPPIDRSAEAVAITSQAIFLVALGVAGFIAIQFKDYTLFLTLSGVAAAKFGTSVDYFLGGARSGAKKDATIAAVALTPKILVPPDTVPVVPVTPPNLEVHP